MSPPRDREDLYAALGVAPSAPPAEIDAAFRRLARRLHPDRNPGNAGAEARFKLVARAYTVLKNPPQRAQYDALRRPARPNPTTSTAHRPAAPRRTAPFVPPPRYAAAGPNPSRPNILDRQLEAPGCALRLLAATVVTVLLLVAAVGLLVWAAGYFRPRGDTVTRPASGGASPPPRTCSNGTSWYTTVGTVIGSGVVRYIVNGVARDVVLPPVTNALRSGDSFTVYASALDPSRVAVDPCGGGVPPQ